MIDLSVLVCSTHTRYKTFGPKIQEQVFEQYNQLSIEDQARIEVIMVTDNKKMMLGHKRNTMVDMAQGRYVQFIDDDDRIEPDMFQLVLDATESNSDVITFLVAVSMNGSEPKNCRYSIDFTEDRNTDEGYERLPNHICVVKRDLASQASFPNIPYGEDAAYSQLLRPLLHTELHIPKVLYHYDYQGETTETQVHQRAPLRMRKKLPLVDVVIMSKASSQRLRLMTQHAIDTCIAGANSLPVHVVVIEQQKGVRYDHAQTVYADDAFNYNRFANRGAQLGFAPWIMVANNDLNFHDGWLHCLLTAKHPVVSPKNPWDTRQVEVTTNSTGYTNAKYFSGWCFMVSRQVWHDIGGFDEDVAFWCSDDAVIEQVKELGLVPMLVPGSEVDHLASETLLHSADHDWLTWGQVEIFNHKYGQHKFEDDKRYLEWRKSQVNTVK